MEVKKSSLKAKKFLLGILLLGVLAATANLGEASPSSNPKEEKSVSPQSEKVESASPAWYFVDRQNKIRLGPFLRRPTEFSDGVARVYDGKHYIYIDTAGKVIGSASRNSGEFSDGLAAVPVFKGGTDFTGWGYINKKGALAINGPFNRAWRFSEGLAAIELGKDRHNYLDTNCVKYEQPGLLGFINHDGQTVIRAQYQVDRHTLAGDSNFSDGRAVVRVHDKVGYIDKTGKMVIAPIYSVACPFSEGLAAVSETGQKYCYIDINGKPQTPSNFESAEPFHCGYAKVAVDGVVGFCFIDRSGRVVLDAGLLAEQFAEDRAFAELKPHKLSCIDKAMKSIGSETFSIAYPFSEGMALVESDGKWGFINLDGEFAIPCKYSEAGSFRCGLAPVQVQ